MLKLLVSIAPGSAGNYLAALSAAGGAGTALYCPGLDTGFDGLILAGGGDPDPALFGQRPAGSNPPDSRRDRAELTLLEAYAGAGKPVLGICRGMQLINIWAGGTLIQDLGERDLTHRWAGADRAHPVEAAPGSALAALYGRRFWVNSAHHQGVDCLGAGLRATAWSPDGVIEGLEHETLPVFGVQFHPERMRPALGWPGAADGTELFRAFLALCRA